MRVTVCELSHESDDFERDWEGLGDHVRSEKSDLVLLPEMAFCPWFFGKRSFDPTVWREAVAAHDAWESRFCDLGPVMILGSRPIDRGNKRLNEAFVWDTDSGYRTVHTKRYLPDEDGFWEASWYDRSNEDFLPVVVQDVKIGFVICTDIWFFQHARAYGKDGVHFIAHPRATQGMNSDKWLLAGRTAAVVSGAFCISSNHINPRGKGSQLGGMGWIITPESEVLGVTSRDQPFLTKDVDLREADRAKRTYPRYVVDDV